MLSPYRVLDLTTNGAGLCGNILADLGADVIAIEPPTGSNIRQVGPYYRDEPDIEHSLSWWALARNKRSAVLNFCSTVDRQKFLSLVESANVVVESYAPGYLESLGLGYEELCKRNPGIILASVTPFGQDGPKARWAATDMTAWSASGAHYITGDADRAPVRPRVGQAEFHAGAEAAQAVLLALHERANSGMGQHIDVSTQAAAMMATQSVVLSPAWGDQPLGRSAGGLSFGPLFVRFVYPCKDGHVNITLLFGNVLGQFTKRLFAWMCEEGFVDEATRDKDWVSYVQLLTTGEEPVSEFLRCMDAIEQFTRSKTKEELFQATFDRHLLIVPVSTMADIYNSPQLQAREYWTKLALPVANELAAFPGPFAKLSGTPIEYRRRAPRLGEHTGEVIEERDEPRDDRPRATGSSGMPLEGVKVLDFSWVYAAPAATRVFADWGATVVKVESTTHLDALRTGQPFKDGVPGAERSANFCNVNLGKLGITLDLGTPEGREVALKLAAWADIVVENFSPGAMKGRGLAYEDICRVNPDVVMVSTCLAGGDGPHASLAGYGTMGAALSGFHESTGWADRPPAGPFLAYTDYISPRYVAVTALAALDHWRRTGEGQYIDLAQMEAGIHFLGPLVLDYTVNGRLNVRNGNESEEYAPHGVYPCSGDDAWVSIAAGDEAQWQALCEAMGHPEWLGDTRFGLFPQRYAHREALDELIAQWTAVRTPAEVEAILQARGVAAHRVSTSNDVLNDEQLQHRGHFATVAHPEVGEVLVERPRFRMSRSQPIALRSAPMLGEHNEHVLREILGMSDDEIDSVVAAGALA